MLKSFQMARGRKRDNEPQRGEEWAGKEGPTNETRKAHSEKEKETPGNGGAWGELVKPTERSFKEERVISCFMWQGKSVLKVSH